VAHARDPREILTQWRQSVSNIIVPGEATLSRRGLLSGSGKVVLSATAVALLAGRESLAKGGPTPTQVAAMSPSEGDVAILNVALGLEHEAIAAYQLGAESGLLSKPTLGVAVMFQGQHKEHRDALIATIQKLGGKPVMAKPNAEYAKGLNAASLKSETDVLKLAAKLEKGAANAYLGVIPSFEDRDLAKVSGRLAADETMHWTVLASALKWPLPQSALTFGA
jgi:rubrerythrin